MNNFVTNVWNQIEDMFLNDYFIGTKKGVVKEIDEYAFMLLKDYKNLKNSIDETEYIRNCLTRDCMSE